MDSRAIMGCILEHLGDIFWQEFKEQDTIDDASERQLFQGILCQKMDINTHRCRLVNFLLLLVRLVDGQDVEAIYKDNQQCTPLEDALGCFKLVMSDFECGCTQKEVEHFQNILKEQAVIVCCRAGDFNKALLVFLSLFGDTIKEDPSKPNPRVKVQRQLQAFINEKKVSQRFLDLHSYEIFLQEAKTILEKVHSAFSPPGLLSVQKKAEQKQRITDDDKSSSSSMVIASSSEGTSSRRSSPLKGLRKMSRSRLDRGDHPMSDEASNENGSITSETDDNCGNPKGLRFISPRKRKCRGTKGDSNDREKSVYTLAVLEAAVPSLTDEDWTDIRGTSNPFQDDSPLKRQKANSRDASNASSAPSLDQSQSPIAAPSLDQSQTPIAAPSLDQSQTPIDAPSLDQSHSPIPAVDPQSPNDLGLQSPTVSTPKRGRSIRDRQYQPNRNRVRDNTSPPERAADSSDDLMSSGSSSGITTTSFPTLKSPKVRHSLDPSHAFRQLSRKKQFWSYEECKLLKKAVDRFGVGKWSEMNMAYDFNGRTNVNLKDKWRNMVKNGEV